MPLVSIVIPAHNEEENIEALLEEIVNEKELSEWDFEVVVIDDNSSDRTGEIVEQMAKKCGAIRVLRRRGRSSFGEAVKLGFKEARGDIIVPVMGDRSDNPSDIPKLLKAVLSGYDIAIGSRFIKGSKLVGYPRWKLFANRLYNALLMVVTGRRISDFTNAFKAYRREVLDRINPSSRSFDITAEIALKAVFMGARMVEVPVEWRGRSKGEAKFKLTVGASYLATLLRVWVEGIVGRALSKARRVVW